MVLDQFSIFIAIGFSGASLGLAFFMMWIVGRSESHLLNWSIGLVFIVMGVAFFGSVIKQYDGVFLLASFLLLIVGFGLLYSGVAKFCSNQANWPTVVALVVIGIAATTTAFVLGYSGVGTIVGNVFIGVLLFATGHQHWAARAEFPLLMTANAVLYLIAAASFFACGYALADEGQFILTARPANWAEDINSVVVIAGLTGIGTPVACPQSGANFKPP